MNRIGELRRQKKWRQEDLADKLHTKKNTISRYENEKLGIDAKTINKLCEIFGVTADYLLGRSDTPTAQLTEAEWQLLAAYRAASLRDRGLVDQILAPYIQVAGEKDSAI